MLDPLAVTQADLDRARDRLRRVRMGPALSQSDAQLDAAAAAGEADVPTAEALWMAANPGPLSRLLEAEPEE
jgi:hypothetical protein